MKKLLSILFMAGILSHSQQIKSQLSEGGIPQSFSISQKSATTINTKHVPARNIEELREEDIRNRELKHLPYRYGKKIPVGYSLDNSGTWQFLPNGDKLWRLKIVSPGAKSLNFMFDSYNLPRQAKLYLYSVDKEQVLGAFTSKNNQPSGKFSTSLLFSDEVIIEYFEPAIVDFPGELQLSDIVHGYKDLRKGANFIGDAGDCHINAACPQGDPIRKQIRSTALIIVDGYTCTSTLINNTNQDEKPYLLTAEHCKGDPENIVAWFNFESEYCENPIETPSYQTLSGTVTRAINQHTDLWLLELNDNPPDSFDVYYSGWNRTTASSINGIVYGIHHPVGDIKKINWSTAGVVSDYREGDTEHISGPDAFWRVNYWEGGTATEIGSSGSALFDKNLRIIGQLYGGFSNCDNIGADWYGRLGVSWDYGPTSDSRLKEWLDPAGSGITVLDGLDPSQGLREADGRVLEILSPVNNYLDTLDIVPSIIIQNYGALDLTNATLTYSVDDTLKEIYEWTGSLSTGKTDTVEFTTSYKENFGKHQFIAKISVAGDTNSVNDSLVKTFNIVDCGNNEIPIFQGFNTSNAFVCWNKTQIIGPDADLSLVQLGEWPDTEPTEGSHMLKFNAFDAYFDQSIRYSSSPFSTKGFDSIMVSFDWRHNNESKLFHPNDRVVTQYSFDGKSWVSVEEVYRIKDDLDEWVRKEIILPDVVNNQSQVYCGLLFVSDYGNNCYLDSLVISADSILQPYADFSAYPRTVYVDSIVTFYDSSINGPFNSWKWKFGKDANPDSALGPGPHNVSYSSVGDKTITLVLDDSVSVSKTDYINVREGLFPPADLTGKIYDSNNVFILWNPHALFQDDFERGNLSEWDTILNISGEPEVAGKLAEWHINSERNLNGDYAAAVNPGTNIESWMITPAMIISEQQVLRFDWSSNYRLNFESGLESEFYVLSSIDSGANWDTLWRYSEVNEWIDWDWQMTEIDLSVLEDQKCWISFQVVGDLGGDIAIDNVFIGDGFITENESETFAEHNTVSLNRGVSAPLQKLAVFANYKVYRNNKEIATTIQNTYDDKNLSNGIYEYYVTSMYLEPEGESAPSNKLVFDIKVSIEPPTGKRQLSVHPNPSSGLFNIWSEGNYQLEVYDVRGSLLKAVQVVESEFQLDLSTLEPGLYFLRFTTPQGQTTQKVIIE